MGIPRIHGKLMEMCPMLAHPSLVLLVDHRQGRHTVGMVRSNVNGLPSALITEPPIQARTLHETHPELHRRVLYRFGICGNETDWLYTDRPRLLLAVRREREGRTGTSENVSSSEK